MTTPTPAADAQTCPRRTGEFGPWPHGENLDHWRTDRWVTTAASARDRADAEDRRLLADLNAVRAGRGEPPRTLAAYQATIHRSPHGDLWLPEWPAPVPRTCSFCGGCHPEDVLRLMAAGWESEATDKWYKRYLHPPGFHAHIAAAAAAPGGPGAGFLSFPDPIPPVKVYVMHFTDAQIDRFNRIIDARRGDPAGQEATPCQTPPTPPDSAAS